MAKTNQEDTRLHKEFVAERLKERIYGTLALIAVLITIDPEHIRPIQAAYLTCGTIISLWAASLVATRVSQRIIFQDQLDEKWERERRLRTHAPMLTCLIFPLIMISLAAFEILSMSTAIDISIMGSVFLLVGWSLASARSFQARKLPTIILAGTEILIGVAIVGLKVLVAH